MKLSRILKEPLKMYVILYYIVKIGVKIITLQIMLNIPFNSELIANSFLK